jgi:site-specific DNA-methyltransferase (adenine-specific)
MTRGYMLRSQSDDWETPKVLLQSLEKEFGPLFDPCPVKHDFDGLSIPWKDPTFVNPPYSDWPRWVKKGVAENAKGKTIIFLLPARTDTRTFHEYIYHKAEIRFLKGRLKFRLNGQVSKSSATFPSMLVIFSRSNVEAQHKFF